MTPYIVAGISGILLLLGTIFGYLVKLTRAVSTMQGERKEQGREHGKKLDYLMDTCAAHHDELLAMKYRQEMEDRLAAMRAADSLHAPTHFRRDELMERLKTMDLHGGEWKELDTMLDEVIADPETPESKRFYAIQAANRVKFEVAKLNGNVPAPPRIGKASTPCNGKVVRNA